MEDAQIAWGIERMKEFQLVTGGDAASSGIGVMTDARWQSTRDYMVEAGLLGKAVDFRQGYDLRFVHGANKVLP
ncbi:NitT/TauT family transport system substrate-binding protein [Pseudomonas duriflava]|uniref:NitT/TauT family transport system substrate-binding protein n=2 Tax=Pseudomonas duriflava TaxID=459528 RepID=A0A562PU81_9PSED|nr:NitT/TauT family transport system substrate-binding protein [Pseudomonas duriflava]